MKPQILTLLQKLTALASATCVISLVAPHAQAAAVAPDQTGVFSGFQRRIFSTEATNNQPSLFLRLKATYSP